jgi:hypothetical protein
MDEMTLLRELGEDLDEATGGPAPRTRHRVLTGIADGGRGGRMPRPAWRRAVPTAALLAGGLAATVALTGGLPTGGAPDGGAPGGDVPGDRPPATGTPTVDARDILLAAARTARAGAFEVPDPDAFVYTRSQQRAVDTVAPAGQGPVTREERTSVREAWLSVDGSRPGAVTPSGSDDLVEIATGREPAYDTGLPQDAAGMRERLYREAGTYPAKSPDAVAFQAGMALAQESLLRPATRAALYEAMAAIPGVEVVGDAENVAGRRGVAVAARDGDWREELIFDPATHEVIGSRTVNLVDREGLRAGTVMFSSAVLEVAVVDRVRLRPDGTMRPGPIEGGAKEKAKPAPTEG